MGASRLAACLPHERRCGCHRLQCLPLLVQLLPLVPNVFSKLMACEPKADSECCSSFVPGGRRGIGLNEERDQTLNQLLTGRPGQIDYNFWATGALLSCILFVQFVVQIFFFWVARWASIGHLGGCKP